MIFFSDIKKYADENYVPVIRDASAEILFETVKELRPSRILEIGTAIGYSGLIMMSAYEHARLTTIELKQAYADIATDNFKIHGVSDKAEILRGDAGGIIKTLTGKFDFIFLDGPKTKYPVYYETLINLLETGGILFADNVSLQGRVTGETPTPKGKETITEGLRKFLDVLKNDKRMETRLLKQGDGITISRKIADI